MVVVVTSYQEVAGSNHSYSASHIDSMLISKAVDFSRPKSWGKNLKIGGHFTVRMIAYYKSVIFRF